MKFSIQTLLAVLASFALLLASWQYLAFVLWGLALGFPAAVGIIGLTSPQKGRQLDPSRRWYLFLLVKTWGFTVAALIMAATALPFFPGYADRIDRAMKGDFRKYQTVISFYAAPLETPDLEDQIWRIYDAKGFVGECRPFDVWEKEGESLVFGRVSTDRQDVVYGKRDSLRGEWKEDGALWLHRPSVTP